MYIHIEAYTELPFYVHMYVVVILPPVSTGLLSMLMS